MREQTHLSTVVANTGTGDATDAVRALLELGLKNKLENEVDDRLPGLHVSMAGKCPRQVYFILTGEPKTEPLTLDSWMTLNLGKKAEELYLDLLQSAGVKVLTQQRVTLEVDGETIHGTLDLIIEVPEEVRALIPGLDPRELWELKTKNSRAMGWLLKNGGPKDDDGYLKQVGGYLKSASEGRVPKPTTMRGRLIYTAVGATKGEPLFHAWFVPYDREAVEQDLARLAALGKAAREGRDPGVPEEFKDGWAKFPCSYCDWRSKCHPRR